MREVSRLSGHGGKKEPQNLLLSPLNGYFIGKHRFEYCWKAPGSDKFEDISETDIYHR